MGNRVCPSQQVQDSPNDQVGNPRYKDFQRDTPKWILKNINMCGKNQEKNVSNDEKQQNKSDKELRTNYFGEIAFVNNHTAKYIRVHSTTTKSDTVLTRMTEKWKLEIPHLLIYVHDSMNRFEKTCQTSLTKAIQGTGAWIITDGKREYVNTDETAHEQPIIIGISQLDNQQGTRKAENDTEMTSLDRHHSHFILIDDGSGDTSSTTSDFWEQLESEISKKKSDNGVPIVLILQVDDERNTPAIIVKTSDKKASGTKNQSDIHEDISTSKLTHICEENVDSCDSDIGLDILQALLKDAKKKEKITSHKYHKYHLKLFEIAKNISIDTIWQQEDILNSCMMAAILLDKVEYVKLILDNDFDLKTFLTYDKLEELYNAEFEGSLFNEVLPNMRKSLDKHKEMNNWKHVKRLLDHVCESKPQLRYLDGIVVKAKNNGEETSCKKQGCSCVRTSCCTSMKNINSSDKPNDQHPWLDLFVWSVLHNRKDMAKLFWQRGKPDYIKASTPRDTQIREQTTNDAGSEADQGIDFMMDAMAAALFAHALLSAMSHEIDDKDFKEKCEKDSRDFTNLASGILKEGYNKGGVNLAKKLLIQKQKRWGNTSCVLIAVNANNKQFISEHACQEVFNNIWMGHIDQETGIIPNTLKLFICTLFPLLILCWVTFIKEDEKPSEPVKPDTGPNSKNNPTDSSEQRTLYLALRQEPTIFEKLKYFYHAPVVIFFHNVISYMLFLGLYSYILMSKVNRYLSWQEIVLCVWVFTIFTQEVIQVCSTPGKDLNSKWHNYKKDGWNSLDMLMLVLFLCGMILRIIDNPQVAEYALAVHGVNLITFYLRLLHIFAMNRELGPKLVMIIKMVINIAYFFMILVVFIVAYGIASHSILYPHTEPSFETLTDIFGRPYWNIYGELMLDKIEGSADCTNDPALYNSGAYSRCPTEFGKYFVPLLMGVYMLMCNILLLNLLIAMFSVTFEEVQRNSYLYWSLQQYSLINEYANRPKLVPPVNIFAHLYQLIEWIRSCYRKKGRECNDDITTVFCIANVVISDKEKKMVETFYKNGLENISSNVSEADSANLEKRMEQIEKQLKKMQREILEKLESSKVLSR